MFANSEGQAVREPLLWAVGLDEDTYPPGTMLRDRYRAIADRVVADTRPYELPEVPGELPTAAIAYLQLSRYPLHLPRPYGLLRWGEDLDLTEILLLENVPLTPEGQLMPSLAELWPQATPLRQINLLWQVLRLWEPLAEHHAASTLLERSFVRADGAWVRLLELKPDITAPSLVMLGDLWMQWLDGAHPDIAEPLAEFVYALSRGEFDTAAAIARLEAIACHCFEGQPLTVRIATATDVGLRRERNEDACYPPPHQRRSQLPAILRDRLLVVCDGLGGHEGGEIASKMAIGTLEQQVRILLQQVETDPEPFVPEAFCQQLEAIARVANNQIAALNDRQQRQAQQRMGTTLVMAVMPRPQGKLRPEVYVMHLGDSRAYWIDANSCRQITLDDDVATREAVLGYSFPAYASQRMDGGALIQALGTRSSEAIVPRLQRFLVDEEFLLLLCSDGLSDFERVDQVWRQALQPVLTSGMPLSESCQKLVDLANRYNGHDNITVGLLHCRLAPPDPQADARDEGTEDATTAVAPPPGEPIEAELVAETPPPAEGSALATIPADASAIATLEEAPLTPTPSRATLWLAAIALGLGLLVAAAQIAPVRQWLQDLLPAPKAQPSPQLPTLFPAPQAPTSPATAPARKS